MNNAKEHKVCWLQDVQVPQIQHTDVCLLDVSLGSASVIAGKMASRTQEAGLDHVSDWCNQHLILVVNENGVRCTSCQHSNPLSQIPGS